MAASPPAIILVVSDDLHTQNLVRMNLAFRKFGVLSAIHLKGALETLENASCDLVILDITSSQSFETLRKLRGAYSDMPILTLDDEFIDGQRPSKASVGAGELLLKPFRPQDLISSVRRLLRSRPAQYQAEPEFA